MKIVRFKNSSFGIRRWKWNKLCYELLTRLDGEWLPVTTVARYHEVVEMTWDEVNDCFDKLEASAKKNQPNIDRGVVVSRRSKERTKGPSR